MKKMGIVVLIFGILVLTGGIMGHLKAGSNASLISGGIFGILLIADAIGILKGKMSALYVGVLLSFILDGFFTYRFAATQKFFPAGIMSLMCLAVIFYLVFGVRRMLKKA